MVAYARMKVPQEESFKVPVPLPCQIRYEFQNMLV